MTERERVKERTAERPIVAPPVPVARLTLVQQLGEQIVEQSAINRLLAAIHDLFWDRDVDAAETISALCLLGCGLVLLVSPNAYYYTGATYAGLRDLSAQLGVATRAQHLFWAAILLTLGGLQMGAIVYGATKASEYTGVLRRLRVRTASIAPCALFWCFVSLSFLFSNISGFLWVFAAAVALSSSWVFLRLSSLVRRLAR